MKHQIFISFPRSFVLFLGVRSNDFISAFKLFTWKVIWTLALNLIACCCMNLIIDVLHWSWSLEYENHYKTSYFKKKTSNSRIYHIARRYFGKNVEMNLISSQLFRLINWMPLLNWNYVSASSPIRILCCCFFLWLEAFLACHRLANSLFSRTVVVAVLFFFFFFGETWFADSPCDFLFDSLSVELFGDFLFFSVALRKRRWMELIHAI